MYEYSFPFFQFAYKWGGKEKFLLPNERPEMAVEV